MGNLDEIDVRERAAELAAAEAQLAEEYLRLMGAGHKTWQAQKMAELTMGKFVRRAEAEYQIALARLRRS